MPEKKPECLAVCCIKSIHNQNLVDLEELGLNQKSLDKVIKKLKNNEEVIIGKIDQNGAIQSKYGSINNVICVNDTDYIKRIRFDLYLIIINEKVGIKKCYGNNKTAFINEFIALKVLSENGCNVPMILDADFHDNSITISYINGIVLKSKLAKLGSKIFDDDFSTSFNNNNNKNWTKRINEGRKNLSKAIDEQFIYDIKNQLKMIHSNRIIINDIKYGNILIEEKTKKPYFIDFDYARYYPRINQRIFNSLTDNDWHLFDLHFGNGYINK